MKTTSFHLTLVAIGLFTLMSTVAATAAESLSVLLQKGIFAEETEGNLDAAIKIYEGIVKDGEANRSVAAQAQYRLGVCLVKKGKHDEAEAAEQMLFAIVVAVLVEAAETSYVVGQPGQLRFLALRRQSRGENGSEGGDDRRTSSRHRTSALGLVLWNTRPLYQSKARVT